MRYLFVVSWGTTPLISMITTTLPLSPLPHQHVVICFPLTGMMWNHFPGDWGCWLLFQEFADHMLSSFKTFKCLFLYEGMCFILWGGDLRAKITLWDWFFLPSSYGPSLSSSGNRLASSLVHLVMEWFVLGTYFFSSLLLNVNPCHVWAKFPLCFYFEGTSQSPGIPSVNYWDSFFLILRESLLENPSPMPTSSSVYLLSSSSSKFQVLY